MVLDHEQNSLLVMGINNFNESIIKEKLKNKTFEEQLNVVKVSKDDF